MANFVGASSEDVDSTFFPSRTRVTMKGGKTKAAQANTNVDRQHAVDKDSSADVNVMLG